MAPTGNLYGTTRYGGAHQSGVVLEVTASGTETVLHSMGRYAGTYPEGSLIRDAKGNLYGTTEGASYFGLLGSKYFGSVFKLEKQNLQYLYRFTDRNAGRPSCAAPHTSVGQSGDFSPMIDGAC